MLRLPRTAGCLVCGRENPIGLKLDQFVHDDGTVTAVFTPSAHHIGFHGVIHGGILATVLDEAMVWAATWAGLRFCLAAEMTVRFRSPAAEGRALTISAKPLVTRGKLVTTTGTLHDGDTLVAEATGKYIKLGDMENRAFVETLVEDAATFKASDRLRVATE